IPRPHRVYSVHLECRRRKTFKSPLCDRAFRTDFYDYEWHQFRQMRHGSLQVFSPRDLSRFARIGQKDIDIREDFHQFSLPEIVWIIIGVERNGQASCLDPLKQFDNPTPPAASRSRAIWPSGSSPMREMKPTRLPSAERLCATMADELPRVSIMRSASSSRSGGSSLGRPCKIRSRFNSPAIVTSKRGTLGFLGQVFFGEHDHSG